ncbi:neural cell adhesion molecule 1-like, partial [Sinocyclocheilus grahami]|uniref:neural cell adhesion molecule 1-like n=1 Tax=Sinocyclocheilus grahami TaxID=75366 RepID=UPI0007ACAFCB
VVVIGGAKEIDWFAPTGEKIEPGRLDVSVIRNDETSSTLTIYNAKVDNAGTYKCVASSGDREAEATVNLKIYQKITFTNVPSPQEFTEGDNAIIVCDVMSSPPPTVLWKYKGAKIQFEKDVRFRTLSNNHLQIRGIRKTDEGVYTCEGRIKARGEVDFRSIKVVVNVLPTIRIRQAETNGTADMGFSTLLACDADGFPEPMVTWARNNVPLESGEKYNFNEDGSEMTILEVTKLDDGDYTCIAKNKAGESEQELSLKVFVKPKITYLESQTTTEMDEQVTLTCEATGDPTPTITWSFGTRVFTEGEQEHQKRIYQASWTRPEQHKIKSLNYNDSFVSSESGMMPLGLDPNSTSGPGAIHTQSVRERRPNRVRHVSIVPEASPQHAIQGRCSEEGPFEASEAIKASAVMRGEASFSLSGYAPKILGSVTVYTWEGNPANISCEVLAHPSNVSITWLRDGVQLPNANISNIKIYNTPSASYLEMKGQSYRQVCLFSFVYALPFITDAPKILGSVTVYTWEGNPANISCEVLAHPSNVSITWLRDGVQLPNANISNIKIYNTPSASYLEVNPESQSDFGNYNCTASNEIGTESKEFIVIPADVPSAPSITQVQPYSSTAQVLFEEPESTGGVPVLKYRAEWRAMGRGKWVQRVYEVQDGESYGFFSSFFFNFPLDPLGYSYTNGIFHFHTEDTEGEPSPPILEGTLQPKGNSLKVKWTKQDDGGSPITHYLVKYKAREDSDWKPEIRLPNVSEYVMLIGLEWDTEYDVFVVVENQQGKSKPGTLTFRTSSVPAATTDSMEDGTGLNTGVIVGILILVCVLLLLIVDATCCFLNKCGILMCICGKPRQGTKGKDIETGKAAFVQDVSKEPIVEVRTEEEATANHDAEGHPEPNETTPLTEPEQVKETAAAVVDLPLSVPTNSDTVTDTTDFSQSSPVSESTTLTSSITAPTYDSPNPIHTTPPNSSTPKSHTKPSSSSPPSSDPANVTLLVDLGDSPEPQTEVPPVVPSEEPVPVKILDDEKSTTENADLTKVVPGTGAEPNALTQTNATESKA